MFKFLSDSALFYYWKRFLEFEITRSSNWRTENVRGNVTKSCNIAKSCFEQPCLGVNVFQVCFLTDFSHCRYQAGAPLTEGVEVALDPSELELDPAAMQARLVLVMVGHWRLLINLSLNRTKQPPWWMWSINQIFARPWQPTLDVAEICEVNSLVLVCNILTPSLNFPSWFYISDTRNSWKNEKANCKKRTSVTWWQSMLPNRRWAILFFHSFQELKFKKKK